MLSFECERLFLWVFLVGESAQGWGCLVESPVRSAASLLSKAAALFSCAPGSDAEGPGSSAQESDWHTGHLTRVLIHVSLSIRAAGPLSACLFAVPVPLVRRPDKSFARFLKLERNLLLSCESFFYILDFSCLRDMYFANFLVYKREVCGVCLPQGHNDFILFSCRIFIVPGFTCKCRTHFEFIVSCVVEVMVLGSFPFCV